MSHFNPPLLVLVALLFISTLALTACGQTGPLSLPDDSKDKKSALKQTSTINMFANGLTQQTVNISRRT